MKAKRQRDDRTRDSRFLRHKLSTGEAELYCMYGRNIRAEGDGIAYHELNFLRAILLEPILFVLMGTNLLLHYSSSPSSSRVSETANTVIFVFAHVIGFICNILRYFVACLLFVIEVLAWPPRVIFGLLMMPIGVFLCAGHIYALPCIVLHALLQGAGPSVVRRVKVKMIHSSPKTFNAGGLGTIHCYETDNVSVASYIGFTFKLRQRCGIGPECVWVRGRRVFISRWTPINITTVFGVTKEQWRVLDLSNYEWRKTIFQFDRGRSNEAIKLGRAVSSDAGLWAFVRSSEDLGVVSNLFDLEAYYNGALGWNKYHMMQAEGHQIRVIRKDRRAFSHLLAAISSLLLYLQFRDPSKGWLGLYVELYALIIANYALLTACAAEVLIGKASDLVDAKSDRYGVIVTRAIDRGYVRGFHVPNGDWLRYENGDSSLPVHEVTSTEVNVTCNSYVYESELGVKIKVIPYHRHPPSFDLPWNNSIV